MVSHMAPFLALPEGWRWLAQACSHGMAGVDVFFILSGMVIVRSLESFEFRPLPFLIARASRIMPAFLVVFAIAVAVQPLARPFAIMPWIGPTNLGRDIWAEGWPDQSAVHLLAHLTMTHGLFPDGSVPFVWVTFLGAAWSLSTEWQFYVLAALVGVAAADRSGYVSRLAAALLVIALAGAVWSVVAPPEAQFSRAFLPNKAHYFALGVASAGLAAGPRRGGRRGYAIVLAVVLGLCAAGRGGFDKILPPLAWTLCLAAERHPRQALFRPLARLLSSRPLLALGAISYPLYLVNEPIHKLVGIALATVADGDGAIFDLLWIPLSIGLPIAAATWLHRVIERPALRWGREFARLTMARRGRFSPAG
jgi:peptidoglycan/LPS O-acetylase OafA/YrhL